MCNAIQYLITLLLIISNVTAEDDSEISDELSILMTRSVPDLSDGAHKGQSGKICVIGGSQSYTGAPYFSAITSLKVGADLAYVLTTQIAAPVIKSYSPDLIVYPWLDRITLASGSNGDTAAATEVREIIKRMDLLVIGPGLGRENKTEDIFKFIINESKERGIPLVIDADGLYFLSKNIKLLQEYPRPGVILTPNSKELSHLEKALTEQGLQSLIDIGANVYVLSKGKFDSFVCRDERLDWSLNLGGSGRRAAGQGDILAGALGTMFNWALKTGLGSDPAKAAQVASYGAAKLTRAANEAAFAKLARSMTASDMIVQIHEAFAKYFEYLPQIRKM